MRHLTDEPARDHSEVYSLAGGGQIRNLSGVAAMDRCDVTPHKGHSATSALDLTTKIIESTESLTVSTTNPLGTREEIRMPVLMALIPPLENRELTSQYHRM